MMRTGMFALVGLSTLLPGSAQAYCTMASPVWTDATPVRIVLHQSLDDEMRHSYGGGVDPCTSDAQCGPGGICDSAGACVGPVWTRAELVRSVSWVISRLNESSGANVPFIYLDETAPATCAWLDDCHDSVPPPLESCYQANTIVVAPDNCFSGVGATDWPGNNPYTRQAQIIIARSINYDGVPRRRHRLYEHALVPDIAEPFELVLLHEVAHALGLGHPGPEYVYGFNVCNPTNGLPGSDLCPTNPDPDARTTGCAVMNSDRGISFSNHALGDDDVNGLRALYGPRSPPVMRVFEDFDFTTSPFYEVNHEEIVGVMGHVALANWLASFRNHVTAVGRVRAATNGSGLQTWRWNWSLGTIATTGVVGSGLRSHGPIGITETSTNAVVAHHVMRGTTDVRRYRRRLYSSTAPLAGSTWSTVATNPPAGAIDDTYHAGVSVAYDPGSTATLYAIRGDTSEVVIVGRLGSTWSVPVATGTFSYSAPALACAPTQCYLITVEAPRPVTDSNQTRLMFRDFVWVQTGSTAFFGGGPQYTTGFNVWGDPSATMVRRTTGAYEVLVTFAGVSHFGGGVFGTRVYPYRLVVGSTSMTYLIGSVLSFPWTHPATAVGGDDVYADVLTLTSD